MTGMPQSGLCCHAEHARFTVSQRQSPCIGKPKAIKLVVGVFMFRPVLPSGSNFLGLLKDRRLTNPRTEGLWGVRRWGMNWRKSCWGYRRMKRKRGTRWSTIVCYLGVLFCRLFGCKETTKDWTARKWCQLNEPRGENENWERQRVAKNSDGMAKRCVVELGSRRVNSDKDRGCFWTLLHPEKARSGGGSG